MTNYDKLLKTGVSARELWLSCHLDGEPQVTLEQTKRWLMDLGAKDGYRRSYA